MTDTSIIPLIENACVYSAAVIADAEAAIMRSADSVMRSTRTRHSATDTRHHAADARKRARQNRAISENACVSTDGSLR